MNANITQAGDFRHGTTTLFASLDVRTGEVMSKCQQHHTQKEFLNFLRSIESQVDAGMELHLVMDNYATHKTYSVRK
jgi:poly(A) polymerase Pap1